MIHIEERIPMVQGKKSRLEKIVNSSYSNTTGIVVQKNGNIVYEKYFNEYTAAQAVHIASVTKSIISALIGIAIEQGHIKSVEQNVLEFFPHYTILEGEKTIQSVTIREMLTMTAPYKYKNEPYEQFFESENWIHTALDLLGGKKQEGTFTYAAIVGSHILSGILAQATGESVFDFATKNLFSKMDIQIGEPVVLHNKEEHLAFFQDKNTKGWVADSQGINTAGFGLTLTPVDMAKIGQLYLNGGRWKEKQLIPAWWIAESTKEHSRCNQWGNLPYGYLWWIIDEKEHSYAALGDGGNVIYINEKKHMVISIASQFVPNANDRMKLIKEYIEPLFEDSITSIH